MEVKSILETKPSRFKTHEMIKFPNGEWYDVVKDSYVYVRYGTDLPWFIRHREYTIYI